MRGEGGGGGFFSNSAPLKACNEFGQIRTPPPPCGHAASPTELLSGLRASKTEDMLLRATERDPSPSRYVRAVPCYNLLGNVKQVDPTNPDFECMPTERVLLLLN